MIDIDGKSFLPVNVVVCFLPHDDSASDTPNVPVFTNAPVVGRANGTVDALVLVYSGFSY